MKTIALSRLIGSEAAKIARQVSEALGYTLVNKRVLEGIFRQYGLTNFGDLGRLCRASLLKYTLFRSYCR